MSTKIMFVSLKRDKNKFFILSVLIYSLSLSLFLFLSLSFVKLKQLLSTNWLVVSKKGLTVLNYTKERHGSIFVQLIRFQLLFYFALIKIQ